MDHKAMARRIEAAQAILTAKELDHSSFESLRKLLAGIDPKLDTVLASAGKAFRNADQLLKGDVMELVLENIPDVTPEDKKRKKAILLFLKFWNDLKSEVARVEKELAHAQSSHTNPAGNILAAAKGPLGLITLIAVGIVALKMTEVTVRIQNSGCDPMTPVANFSVNIPGLRLPKETIATGGEGIAVLPPLTATVNATNANLVRLNLYGMTYDFGLSDPGIRLIFDGQTLNGTTTKIDLGSAKEHTLLVQC
jgi:hypothetical protein